MFSLWIQGAARGALFTQERKSRGDDKPPRRCRRGRPGGDGGNTLLLGDRTRLILVGKDNQRLTVDTSGPREYQVGETLGLSIDPCSLLTLLR